jgi:energy-coupling factor transporter ATP-binding protein EcfA2
MHDFLIKCVWGHCNILVAGETGSGKTELVKYLSSNTKENEKIISIEDTLELHLDKIFPHRDIVAMKTNNIASYTEALVACMRQNPIWILLAEVRSAEAVMAVRNSISSGHHVISTIHADKASSIPMRMYALLEGSQDIDQYLCSIHRYVQIGIYVKGYYSQALGRFQREIMEICEFYVDDETNRPMHNTLYSKTLDGKVTLKNPTKKLIDYLAIGNVYFENDDIFGLGEAESKEDLSNYRDSSEDNLAYKETSSKALNAALNAETGAVSEEVASTASVDGPKVAVQSQVAAQPVQAVPAAPAVAAQPQVAVQPQSVQQQVGAVQQVASQPAVNAFPAVGANTNVVQTTPVSQVVGAPQVAVPVAQGVQSSVPAQQQVATQVAQQQVARPTTVVVQPVAQPAAVATQQVAVTGDVL